MSKKFGSYLIGWLVALGLFNVITFVTPNQINGATKFTTLFWVAYALITVVFVGQLLCTYYIFRANKPDRVFYNLSVFHVSVICLAVVFAVGAVCVAFVQIPDWLGIILCCITLAFNIFTVGKALATAGAVAAIDEKIKTNTRFIRTLTADAEALMARTEPGTLKDTVKKVYEALRYSDPMSAPELEPLEKQIDENIILFAKAIEEKDAQKADDLAGKLLLLIQERNGKCKILK